MKNHKNRVQSLRLQTWDYRWNGSYFITICTRNKEHFFGEIKDGEMHQNEMGNIAWDFWMEIPKHFSFVTLDAFVVMPNHVHGILIIENNGKSIGSLPCKVGSKVGSLHCKNPTLDPVTINEFMSKISPKPGSVSTIIRSYKSAVSKHIHKINSDFEWQSRFHDHIIRNEWSFIKIQNYIMGNPENYKP